MLHTVHYMHIIYVTRTHTQAVATAPHVSFLPSPSIIENLKEEAKYLGAAKIRRLIPFWENQKPDFGKIRKWNNQKPETRGHSAVQVLLDGGGCRGGGGCCGGGRQGELPTQCWLPCCRRCQFHARTLPVRYGTCSTVYTVCRSHRLAVCLHYL